MGGQSIEDVKVGLSTRVTKTVSESDVYLFAGITGDFDPNHVDEEYCRKTSLGHRVAHGALIVGYTSAASTRILQDFDRPMVSVGYERIRFLKPVYFGYDDATLSPEARKLLDDAFQCLRRVQFRRVVVAGHTDERGTTEYNLALGERRAEAVRRYLAQLGAEPGKLKAISYGKERPANPGHDEAAWAKNRRAEIAPEP